VNIMRLMKINFLPVMNLSLPPVPLFVEEVACR
jgi:hypothetical protein